MHLFTKGTLIAGRHTCMRGKSVLPASHTAGASLLNNDSSLCSHAKQHACPLDQGHHIQELIKTHSSHHPACNQVKDHLDQSKLPGGSNSGHCVAHKKWGHIGLHRLRCHCADFKTRKTQFGHTQAFCALSSLEQYRKSRARLWIHGELPNGEAKIASKSVGNLWRRVYDFSGSWVLALERCITRTVKATWKPDIRTYPHCFHGQSISAWSMFCFLLMKSVRNALIPLLALASMKRCDQTCERNAHR